MPTQTEMEQLCWQKAIEIADKKEKFNSGKYTIAEIGLNPLEHALLNRCQEVEKALISYAKDTGLKPSAFIFLLLQNLTKEYMRKYADEWNEDKKEDRYLPKAINNIITVSEAGNYKIKPTETAGWWRKIINESNDKIKITVEKYEDERGNIHIAGINDKNDLVIQPNDQAIIFYDGFQYYTWGQQK